LFEDSPYSTVPAGTLRAQYEQVETAEFYFGGEIDGFHGPFLPGGLYLVLQLCAGVEIKQIGIATLIQLFGL
jgi:hypothetical protein